MRIKKFKPTSPGVRHRIISIGDLWKGQPHKELIKGGKRNSGRNHHGRICSQHRGGGHKQKFRLVDIQRSTGKFSESTVVRLEYDPKRTGYIALCQTPNGKLFYILAPAGITPGQKIQGENTKKKSNKNLLGNVLKLRDITPGSTIYSIKGKFARAAGVAGTLIKNEDNYTLVRLPSKALIRLPSSSLASVGSVSNPNHLNEIAGKAGASRWKGWRPKVRGVAQNPCDHPMGGKTPVSGGAGGAPKTKWGKLAKWVKTR